MTGNFVKNDRIDELLCQQVTAPVRFLEAVERIESDTDIFIEVGPGKSLTKLLSDITIKPAIATDAGSPSISGILSASAAAFVLGTPLHTSALFAHRFTRPIDLNWSPTFLANPCEQAPLSDIERAKEDSQESRSEQEEVVYLSAQSTRELVQQIIAARTELSPDLLDLENRMLSDLHLNSITVGQILAEASRALGIVRSASLLQYADAKLGEIVQALEDLQRQQNLSAGEKVNEPDGLTAWVRCFSVVEQEQPLSAHLSGQESGDWLIFAPRNYKLTQDLKHVFASIKGIGSVVCLTADLEDRSVNLLLQGAQSVLARQEATHFVLIQHGNIGAAFARTLYLEHPRLTVCVIHLPLNLPSLTAYVVIEVKAARSFVEASYDMQGKRRELVLVPYTNTTANAPLTLDSRDVLLVTGGGKGIAAECAFALAQETGVTLALLGRSRPQDDSILAEHLAKLDAAGVRYHYIPIDVQDADGVAQAVHEIEARFGLITAILHGAGVNKPSLLNMLGEETLKKTLAPKVNGLQNLLSAVSLQQLKYLITFGSVIARTGMQGEAHYALANEWLGQITEAFRVAYPACSCLCIEWSIWSGMGMGERLGSVETLRAEGIHPIPAEEGIAIFRQLLSQRQSTTRIVVTGRFGTTPTLKMASNTLPFLRFLEKPLIFYPGVELVADVNMSTMTDLYLNEHQLQDERLVPAVVGLEAMAQIAMAVIGDQSRKPSFTDAQFIRPLVIPEQGSVTLRMMALVQHDGSVEVAIRSSETAYQVNHFQAVCHFSRQSTEQRPFLQWPASEEATVQLQLPGDLYGQILFHRGRFQRIRRYTYLHARECIVEIIPYTGGAWFARYLPSEFVLGDPASRDALIHAIQACIPQATLLPVSVECISFSEHPFNPEQLIRVYARERERQGNSFTYDVEARNSDGQILEQWSGLHLRLVRNDFLPRTMGPRMASDSILPLMHREDEDFETCL